MRTTHCSAHACTIRAFVNSTSGLAIGTCVQLARPSSRRAHETTSRWKTTDAS